VLWAVRFVPKAEVAAIRSVELTVQPDAKFPESPEHSPDFRPVLLGGDVRDDSKLKNFHSGKRAGAPG
jgi:hypothetical protein